MKTRFLSGLLVKTALLAAPALASDKAACLDAASKAQTLRDMHKLVEAREALRACASVQCPSVVQSDCATWLAEVEQGLPTVVISATDGAGRDRFDVMVAVDGQGPPSRVEGKALPMNPGRHTLHFEAAGGATVDQPILVKEGTKNQSVTVALVRGKGDEREGSDRAQDASLAAVAPGPTHGAPPDAQPGNGERSSPWRTVGWVTAGVGIAGLAVGAIFGLEAISDKNGARCDASSACDAGPLGSARTSATISTVSFVAGGALLAGGVALVLFARERDDRGGTALRLEVGPLTGARDEGLWLRGTW